MNKFNLPHIKYLLYRKMFPILFAASTVYIHGAVDICQARKLSKRWKPQVVFSDDQLIYESPRIPEYVKFVIACEEDNSFGIVQFTDEDNMSVHVITCNKECNVITASLGHVSYNKNDVSALKQWHQSVFLKALM